MNVLRNSSKYLGFILYFFSLVKRRNHLPFPDCEDSLCHSRRTSKVGRETFASSVLMQMHWCFLWLRSMGSQSTFTGQCHFQVSPTCQILNYNSAICFMLVTAWPIYKTLQKMLLVDLVQVPLVSSLGREVRKNLKFKSGGCEAGGKLFNVSSNPLTTVVYGPRHVLPMYAKFFVNSLLSIYLPVIEFLLL